MLYFHVQCIAVILFRSNARMDSSSSVLASERISCSLPARSKCTRK